MPYYWGSGPIEAGGPTNPVGIIVSILEFIASLFGLGQNDTKVLQTAINNTYQNLVTTSTFMYNQLGFLTTSLGSIFGTIKDWLDDLRWAVIVPIIEKIQQILDDITTWLANILDPLITFIQALQKFWATFIQPYLKIILEVIQRARLVLAILKLIGVKWAAKLDADLQLLQSWITAVVQEITTVLNTISTTLGLMVDPTGILRRDFFAGTLFSSLGALRQASSAGTDRVSTPGELTQISNNSALETGAAPLAQINTDGTLNYKPGMDAINSDVDAGYAGLGVPVLGN